MAKKKKIYEYEIMLKWVGKGKKPHYAYTEYGFGVNPPIVRRASNKRNALKQLKLPSTVKVRSIKRV